MKPNRIAVLAAAATLAACVNPELSFKPGVTAGTEVIQRMGPAHHVWPEPDGGATWEYVYGPSGTYMIGVDRAGVVTRIEQVLSEKYFSRVRSGMKPEEVRRAMGPPFRVLEFTRVRETIWDYRYRDAWNYPSVFSVIFDETGVVKTTVNQREFYGAPTPSN